MTISILPQMLPWTEVPGVGATITSGQTYTTYDIRVRNSSLQIVGEVQDFTKCTIVKRFNNVGQCTLLLNASDAMAAYLATPGYGLVITRTISNAANIIVSQDPSFFSGDMWEYKRENKAGQKTLQVIAYDDLRKLAVRDAYPVTIYPYKTSVLSDSPIRYYRMDELPASQPATDYGSQALNGTYINSPTTAAGALDDSDAAVTYNGTTQYATMPSTGLPTGNGNWSMECWINLSSFSGYPIPMMLGTAGTKTQALLVVNPSNQAYIDVGGGNTAGFGAVATGKWYHIVATWDGTTLKHYVNGALGSTVTPGALNLGAATGYIAANGAALTNYCNGSLDEVAIYTTTLSQTRITAHYNLGLSRFAYGTGTDTLTGNAETVIQHFVNNNAGPGAVANRQTTYLVMGTNNNSGSTITGVGTFDKLIAKDGTGLLQRLALASTTPLGFKVVQSGQTLTFGCYVPTDQTSNCIFSDDLGNLGDFTYEVKGPDWEAGGNALVMGGSGVGTARTYYLITDSGSITSWGRVEHFMDQSNTSDLTALSNAAAAAIVALRSTSSLTLQLIPQAGLIYGVNFNLGDKVTYVIDGAYLQDIVREVQIDLDPALGEVVTPAVGSPNTAALMHAYAAYVQRTQAQIAAIRNRVANIERRSS